MRSTFTYVFTGDEIISRLTSRMLFKIRLRVPVSQLLVETSSEYVVEKGKASNVRQTLIKVYLTVVRGGNRGQNHGILKEVDHRLYYWNPEKNEVRPDRARFHIFWFATFSQRSFTHGGVSQTRPCTMNPRRNKGARQ